MTSTSIDQPTGEQEAWTFVSSKRTNGAKKKAATQLRRPPSVPLRQGTESSGLSVAQVQSDHERIKKQWLESSSYRRLKELMASQCLYPPVAKAICLGLGSFDPADGSWQSKRRAHVQFAAFVTMVESLREQSKGPVQCYFQDPCFSETDKEFLSEFDCQIVDTPAGFEMVTENSLLVGIHLYRGIYSRAIEKCVPAMFVGTDYDTWESCGSLDWAKMKELDEACDKAKFPQDEEFYPAFTNTTIHWRRSSEGEIAKESPS
ncbi:uncharacterized protein BCR38DRAFT_414872 [Pseudomassariella vexata]|uniref:SRR1-like domain-containing protein n=1 Tax=Pseudomassariella vexata TaxID=1141098 RepID=A0A1Y2D8W7_9PEZI|nr:uncharacterized protein BCR38DRAFT_414872 [Pseudomassariella vexata]ORY55698.1 hypothetical protein BCR38DRAFT_414872 [Pseudomassariella vexata]